MWRCKTVDIPWSELCTHVSNSRRVEAEVHAVFELTQIVFFLERCSSNPSKPDLKFRCLGNFEDPEQRLGDEQLARFFVDYLTSTFAEDVA